MIQLPRVTKKKQYVLTLTNLIRGLNNRDASIEIGDSESPDLLNVGFAVTGALSKRKGTAIVGNDKGDKAVNGIHAAYYGNGSAQLLMAADSVTAGTRRLFYRTTGNWTEITAGGIALVNGDIEFESFYDGAAQVVFITDGTTYQKYTPSTNTLAAATASPTNVGTMLRLYKNRIFTAGSSTVPERVYFSDIGDGDAWTSTNYFDVPSQAITTTGTSGDPITALAVYQDRLIIFKNRSIYAWDTNQLVQISNNHGCVGKRAFCVAENQMFFADVDGIYRLSGNFIEKASKKIQGTWNSIQASLKGKIVMTYFMGKVYVATSSSAASTNDIVLVHYPQLPQDNEGQQPWTYWSGDSTNKLAISCLTTYTATTTTDPILVGGMAVAQTYCMQLEVGDADLTQSTGTSDATILSYWKSKIFSISARHRKQFLTYMAQGSQSLLNCTVSFDFDKLTSSNSYQMAIANSSTYGTGTYGTTVYAGLPAIIGKGTISNRGKFCQFILSNNQASQPWTVYQLKETYSPITLR